MKLPQNRRLIFLGLAIVLVLALAAWRGGLFGKSASTTAGSERRPRRFRWPPRPRGSRMCRSRIDAVGTVQAMNMVTVRTQVDGQLMKLAFVEGQEVKKGDVVAQIDPSLYQAQYDQAIAKKAQDEANLLNARLDLARYQKLIAGNYASQQQYYTQK